MELRRTSQIERRGHPRVRVALPGRYMLPNRAEFPCTATDASVRGFALSAPERGKVGERVIIYIEPIGRIEAVIVRHIEDGFAVTFGDKSRAAHNLARLIELRLSQPAA